MDCEKKKNPLYNSDIEWAEDTFTRASFSGLLTAKIIAEAVLHSLKTSADSTRRYKISQEGFQTLLTDFVVGIRCPTTHRFQLYVYHMKKTLISGVMQVDVEQELIPPDEIAVLGLVKEFEAEARMVYTNARAQAQSPESPVFDFLNVAIDRKREQQDRRIDQSILFQELLQGISRILFADYAT